MKKAVLFFLAAVMSSTLFCGCGADDGKAGCPDFSGKQYSYVSGAEQYTMFKFTANYVESDEDNAGIIVGQSIKPGVTIDRGSKIVLDVSLGLPKSDVPAVAGLDAETAEATLKNSGFSTARVYAASSDFGDGICYATSPAAGEQCANGKTVTVYVSLGSEKVFVKLVSVVGCNYDTAVKKISDAGLNVGTITYEEGDKPAGTVLKQMPEYKDSIEIAEGSLVNLVLAK